jgi:PAS domain-containing protein
VTSPTIEPEREEELRLRALARLTGRANTEHPRAGSAAALGVLFELASSPDTAGGALALLHEIQVHQVEVELQDEELRRSRAELEVSLAHYMQLFELAPFACITVDAQTAISELNLAGTRLLGGDRDAVLGRKLAHLMTPESAGMLRAMLAEARHSDATRTSTRTAILHLASPAAARAVHARVGADTLSGRFLVAMMEAGATAGVPG